MNIKTLAGAAAIVVGAIQPGSMHNAISVVLIAIGGAVVAVDHYVTTLVKARTTPPAQQSAAERMALNALRKAGVSLEDLAGMAAQVATPPKANQTGENQ